MNSLLTSPLPEPSHNDHTDSAKTDLRLEQVVSGFFQYMTNYIANFFCVGLLITYLGLASNVGRVAMMESNS